MTFNIATPLRRGRSFLIGVLCLYLLFHAVSSAQGADISSYKLEFKAGEIMERALRIIDEEARLRGVSVSHDLDPYGSGIIGVEFSFLTTTLGEVKEKRTSANPLFASSIAGLFSELHLISGDVVAVGSSGSYPGLLLAVLSAAKAMNLIPIVTYSLGSSMYGGNRPGFTGLDMMYLLKERGILDFNLAGYSLGGDDDRDSSPLFSEWRDQVLLEAKRFDGVFIYEDSLRKSVHKREQLYSEIAAPSQISCFIGVGGSSVTFGDDEGSASFPNGLTLVSFGSMPEDGLLSLYLRKGVPVIHLLYVHGLAKRWNIPYDSDPFLWRRSWPLLRR